LQNEEVRRRYEAAAASTARKYDWSVITEQFVQVLQKTIAAAQRQVEDLDSVPK
jgi:flagellar biosynthesis chaperone FliJ